MANNSNLTIDVPSSLGDILGVGDYEMETVVLELLADQGVLQRGSVLSSDSVSGKLVLSTSRSVCENATEGQRNVLAQALSCLAAVSYIGKFRVI